MTETPLTRYRVSDPVTATQTRFDVIDDAGNVAVAACGGSVLVAADLYEADAQLLAAFMNQVASDHATRDAERAAEIERLRGEVASLKRKLSSARRAAETVPAGYTQIEAWASDKEIVVLGDAPSEEDDPDCLLHNCDQMGCGAFGSHVIARIPRQFVKEET